MKTILPASILATILIAQSNVLSAIETVPLETGSVVCHGYNAESQSCHNITFVNSATVKEFSSTSSTYIVEPAGPVIISDAQSGRMESGKICINSVKITNFRTPEGQPFENEQFKQFFYKLYSQFEGSKICVQYVNCGESAYVLSTVNGEYAPMLSAEVTIFSPGTELSLHALDPKNPQFLEYP